MSIILQGLGSPLLITQGYGEAADTSFGVRTVLAAIAVRVDETPTLAALLPGGVTVGRGNLNRAVPYASIAETGREEEDNTGTEFIRRTYARVSIFAPEIDDLEEIGLVWKRTFNHRMTPLDFDDGGHGQVLSGPMTYIGEDIDLDGTPLHHGTIDLDILTGHTLDN